MLCGNLIDNVALITDIYYTDESMEITEKEVAKRLTKRTLLELLPQIEDVDEELRRIEAEQDEYDKLDYPISKLKEDLDE